MGFQGSAIRRQDTFNILLRNRQMDKIAQIKSFLEGSPADSFLRHALALEYVKVNDDAAARQTFEQLLTDDPGYVGSYFHLGKVLERLGERDAAAAVYERGMDVAQQQRDMHAYNELQAAYEDL